MKLSSWIVAAGVLVSSPTFAETAMKAYAQAKHGCVQSLAEVILEFELPNGRNVKVGQKIASGGSGSVHYAEVDRSGTATRPMAIKIVKEDPKFPDLQKDESHGAGLQSKVYMAARQAGKSGNRLNVMPIEEVSDGVFLMPRAGKSIFQLNEKYAFAFRLPEHLEQEPSPPSALQRVMGRIVKYVLAEVSVLENSSEVGVVNRDTKPGNWVIAGWKENSLDNLDSGKAHLVKVDYGIATKVGTPAAKDGSIPGTMGYMAPEQMRGAPASIAEDLFGMGTMLAEMLAGVSVRRAREMDAPTLFRIPRGRKDIFFFSPSQIQRVLRDRLKQLEWKLPSVQLKQFEDLSELCVALLQEDPKQRIESVQRLNSPYLRVNLEGTRVFEGSRP